MCVELEGYIERLIDDVVVYGMFLYNNNYYTHVLFLKDANKN